MTALHNLSIVQTSSANGTISHRCSKLDKTIRWNHGTRFRLNCHKLPTCYCLHVILLAVVILFQSNLTSGYTHVENQTTVNVPSDVGLATSLQHAHERSKTPAYRYSPVSALRYRMSSDSARGQWRLGLQSRNHQDKLSRHHEPSQRSDLWWSSHEEMLPSTARLASFMKNTTSFTSSQLDSRWLNSEGARLKHGRPSGESQSTHAHKAMHLMSLNEMWPKVHTASLNAQRAHEIWYFVSNAIRRHKIHIDPTQLYLILYEWEAKQLKTQAQAEKERQARVERLKLENARSIEYNRHLRQFASMLTKEHVKQVSRAKNFQEFQNILFSSKSVDSGDTTGNGISLPREPLIGPRLTYPLSDEPHVIASSSSKLQLPGGIGGGVLVKNMRSTRAVQSDPSDLMPKEYAQASVVQQELMEEEPKYSEEELRSAFESYQEFKRTACQPRNVTLCTFRMLGLQIHHARLAIPQGFYVERCGEQIHQYSCSAIDLQGLPYAVHPDEHYSLSTEVNPVEHDSVLSCSCESPEEQCLPSRVEIKTQAVAVIQISPLQQTDHSTELIVVTNHLSCACQPRCENRLCIPPLIFVKYTVADCGCVCPPQDQRCHELLEGKRAFTAAEIPLPMNGSYILPPCQYGPMDDAHLYHRRCPQLLKKP